MRVVSGENIGDAWTKACEFIMSNGSSQKDEYGNDTREIIGLSIIVDKPTIIGSVVRKHADYSMIGFMKNNFLKTEPIMNWGYSYGQRIFNHDGVNQLETIIQKLLEKPTSRSATIDLMMPKGDYKHAPCACVLDMKIRNNELVMNAFFRSQDIGKKFYADAICCSEIMKKIGARVGKKTGMLTITIASAHIYERDMRDVQEILSEKIKGGV